MDQEMQGHLDGLIGSADVSAILDSSSGVPDLESMRQERYDRNRQSMQALNKSISNKVLNSEARKYNQKEAAVVCVQRYVRGHLGRKRYLQVLLEKAEREENEQRVRMLEQLDEAELLIDNHRLEVLIDDSKTTQKNRHRKYITHVITLQRAWRSYIKRRSRHKINDTCSATTTVSSEMSHTPQSDDEQTRKPASNVVESHGIHTSADAGVVVTHSREIENNERRTAHESSVDAKNQNIENKPDCESLINFLDSNGVSECGRLKNVDDVESRSTLRDTHSPLPTADAECDSVHSDYSELAAPLRDIDLAYSQRRGSLRKSPSPGDANIETEEEYVKRMKKINILSLAQEFADLKRVNDKALPFDLHKTLEDSTPESDTSSQNTDTESVTSPDCLTMPVTDADNFHDDGLDRGADDDHNLKKSGGQREIIGNKPGNCRDTKKSANSLDEKTLKTSLKSYADKTVAKNMVHNNNIYDDMCDKSAIDPENNFAKLDYQSERGSQVGIDPSHGDCEANSNGVVNPKNRSDGKYREVDRRKNKHGAESGKKTTQQRNSNGKYQNSDYNHNRSEVNDTWNENSVDKLDMPKNFAKITKDVLPPKNYDAVLTGQDFDVYNIETALPEMDWMSLETRLQQAAEADRDRLVARRNDREEIRKRLAMGTDDDISDTRPFAPRKPSLQTRLQGGPNLQICFMNDVEEVSPVCRDTEPLVSLHDSPQPSPQMNNKNALKPMINGDKFTTPCLPVNQSDDFLQQQAYLQAEAKLALAQAGTMARMQLEIEKETSKRAPIAEKVGIPVTLVEDKQQRLTWRVLQMMNLAQLQIAVNDLHTNIELLNDELVRLLIERDDLHMEQDSMLVDIEDHTRRAKEISERVKLNQKQKKPGRRK